MNGPYRFPAGLISLAVSWRFGSCARNAAGLPGIAAPAVGNGFAKVEAAEMRREVVIETKPVAEFFADRVAEPAHRAPTSREPVEEPMQEAPMSVFEEELDVPAYLRQGKLLN